MRLFIKKENMKNENMRKSIDRIITGVLVGLIVMLWLMMSYATTFPLIAG